MKMPVILFCCVLVGCINGLDKSENSPVKPHRNAPINEKVLVLVDARTSDLEQEAISNALQYYETLWGKPGTFNFQVESIYSPEWDEQSYRTIRIELVSGPILIDGKRVDARGGSNLWGNNKWIGGIGIQEGLDITVVQMTNLVIHELGHVFWLGHNFEKNNAMNPTTFDVRQLDTSQVASSKGFVHSVEYQKMLIDSFLAIQEQSTDL